MDDKLQDLKPFRLGVWLIEPNRCQISNGRRMVKLHAQNMRALVRLARTPGVLVTQQQLEEQTGSVYQSIAKLRRALGDLRTAPQYIETIAGKGYRLIAPVLPVVEPPRTADPVSEVVSQSQAAERSAGTGGEAASSSHEGFGAPAQRSRQFTIARRIAALSAVILLLVGAVAVSKFFEGDVSQSIAVLPFADMSRERAFGPICNGVAEELTNWLAQIPSVRVIANSSTAIAGSQSLDVKEISRRLGVRYLVSGSVRETSQGIRLTARLIDGENGFTMWSTAFDRRTDQMLDAEAEIGPAIASRLDLTLGRQKSKSLASTRELDSQTHGVYLLAKYRQAQRTPESIAAAIDLYREVTEKRPAFGAAYAALADAYMSQYYYANVPLKSAEARIEPLISHALTLNQDLPEAYSVRGLVHLENFRLAEAVRDLQYAAKLNPNFADAHLRLGMALDYAGKPRESLFALERSQLLDPLNFGVYVRKCIVLQHLGKYDDATRSCRRAMEIQPGSANGYWGMALIELAKGQSRPAVAWFKKALDVAPGRDDIRAQLCTVYIDIGRTLEDAACRSRGSESRSNHFYANHAYAQYLLASGQKIPFIEQLKKVRELAAADSYARWDHARLLLDSGNTADGIAAVQQLEPQLTDAWAKNIWQLRWGDSPRMTIALAAVAAHDEEAVWAQLTPLKRFLDSLENEGYRLYGLHYVRAEVFALEHRHDEAFEELERAIALGWRSTWRARNDAAFSALRNERQFTALMASAEASSLAAGQP